MNLLTRVQLVDDGGTWRSYEQVSIEDTGWLRCTAPVHDEPDEGEYVVHRYPPQRVRRVREERAATTGLI